MLAKKINFKMGFKKYELYMYANLTLVLGNSGCGKSFLYEELSKLSAAQDDIKIRCINAFSGYNNDDLQKLFTNSTDILFVIDNADIILDDYLRMLISLDGRNQYIVFTHTIHGYKPKADSFVFFEINDNIGKFSKMVR